MGLQFTLSEASNEGHYYLPQAALIATATAILTVESVLVETCLTDLSEEEGVITEYLPGPAGGATIPAVYLVPFYRAEVSLAHGLRRLLQASTERLPTFQRVDWEAAMTWLQRTTRSTLAPEQGAAVRLALTEKVAVLTGGPGCAKSFTVRSIVTLARAKRARVVLVAPPNALPNSRAWKPRCCTGCSSCGRAGHRTGPPLQLRRRVTGEART